MRLVGYFRVSSEDQLAGVSLDSQAAGLRALVADGNELAALIDDPGYSAGSLDRPGLREALAMIDDGRADGLACMKIDRLTRKMKDWLYLGETYFFPPRSCPLILPGGALELRTASGRMVAAIQVVISEHELDTIKERTVNAVSYKRTKGEALGHAPYGLRVGADGRTLEPNPDEMRALDLMRRWHREGRTLRAIAAELDALGIPARRGGKWKHGSVAKILQTAPTSENVP